MDNVNDHGQSYTPTAKDATNYLYETTDKIQGGVSGDLNVPIIDQYDSFEKIRLIFENFIQSSAYDAKTLSLFPYENTQDSDGIANLNNQVTSGVFALVSSAFANIKNIPQGVDVNNGVLIVFNSNSTDTQADRFNMLLSNNGKMYYRSYSQKNKSWSLWGLASDQDALAALFSINPSPLLKRLININKAKKKLNIFDYPNNLEIDLGSGSSLYHRIGSIPFFNKMEAGWGNSLGVRIGISENKSIGLPPSVWKAFKIAISDDRSIMAIAFPLARIYKPNTLNTSSNGMILWSTYKIIDFTDPSLQTQQRIDNTDYFDFADYQVNNIGVKSLPFGGWPEKHWSINHGKGSRDVHPNNPKKIAFSMPINKIYDYRNTSTQVMDLKISTVSNSLGVYKIHALLAANCQEDFSDPGSEDISTNANEIGVLSLVNAIDSNGYLYDNPSGDYHQLITPFPTSINNPYGASWRHKGFKASIASKCWVSAYYSWQDSMCYTSNVADNYGEFYFTGALTRSKTDPDGSSLFHHPSSYGYLPYDNSFSLPVRGVNLRSRFLDYDDLVRPLYEIATCTPLMVGKVSRCFSNTGSTHSHFVDNTIGTFIQRSTAMLTDKFSHLGNNNVYQTSFGPLYTIHKTCWIDGPLKFSAGDDRKATRHETKYFSKITIEGSHYLGEDNDYVYFFDSDDGDRTSANKTLYIYDKTKLINCLFSGKSDRTKNFDFSDKTVTDQIGLLRRDRLNPIAIKIKGNKMISRFIARFLGNPVFLVIDGGYDDKPANSYPPDYVGILTISLTGDFT